MPLTREDAGRFAVDAGFDVDVDADVDDCDDRARHTPERGDALPRAADAATAVRDWRALCEHVRADPALLDALLRRVAAVTAPPSRLRWINAAVGRDVSVIDVGLVLYFRSDHKYTRVVTAEREALIRRPLRSLMNELDPEAFWPIHRSIIVNVTAIAGVTHDARGHALVRLKARPEWLPVSVGCEHLFRQM